MTTVQISLPDDLVKQAQEAGLLSSTRVETWVREQLARREQVAELLNTMHLMSRAAGEIGLTQEELADEIRLVRVEKRRSATQ